MITVGDAQASGSCRSKGPLLFALGLGARLLDGTFRQRLQGQHAVAKMSLYRMRLEPGIQPSFENSDRAVDILLQRQRVSCPFPS